jgi:Protein of unknown function (DUF1553)/Protein of unknown function (DUF1549)
MRIFLVCVTTLISWAAYAQELVIYPPSLQLSGPQATQQLVVVTAQNGRATGDVTALAKFTSDPVVKISPLGVVSAHQDGNGFITVTVGDKSAKIPVMVSKTQSAFVPSFRNDILPVLTRTGCNSGACHGALAGKGGLKLSLRGYDAISDEFAITRQAIGRRIDSEAPTDSLLLKKAIRKLPHGGGTRFDEDSIHYRLLQTWIAAGAPSSALTEPTLTKISIYPPAIFAKPKDKFRIIAHATYSDGTTTDATAFTKFASSEEGVATIDEEGQVTVANFGEAGLSASFGSRVATIRATVPYERKVDAEVFTQAGKPNRIDELVLQKLQLLNIPPSGQCSDAEFLRRVYLDAAGVLPKVEELDAFLADNDPNKRAKWIDKVLEKPEFVDYWAHKWSDLLLVSSRKLPSPAMWSFYRTVRRSVADNQPWDQFARSILTASGSTLDSGGGNYFVLHKDVNDLVESTTVTFMGMSVNCCRCHNHPLEKWTQDQYWSLANHFSRVGLKNGTRPGEVIVQTLSEGEAMHPRTGQPMPPTPLDGQALGLNSLKDRREYFVDWLTAKENPYFAKALVNRVWRNFLGRGLVEVEDDIRETNPSTNPELFDYLTQDVITHKYDVKHLIRTILNTRTYQRSSQALPGNAGDDRFYSRYLIRRLSAEVILDAYADISGVPTAFGVVSLGPSGGTSNVSYPAGTRAMQLPDSLLVSRFLDSFGRAERAQTCACERTSDSTVGQALHLNNGKTLNDKLRDPKSLLNKMLAAKTSDQAILDQLFRVALSRKPTADEQARLIGILAEAKTPAERQEALEDCFWAVLSGKEFLFNR